MKPKIAGLAAVLSLAAALFATACGGTARESHAKSLYAAYRTAEDSRTAAEEDLRLAFADISKAAQDENRDGVLAAARRGQEATQEIDDLLTAELEAAQGLQEIELVADDANRLAAGLRLSRQSLVLVVKELEIALDDPFLARRAAEVNDLAKTSTDLAVKGELAVRRADHAVAVALGVEPRPDQLFTTTG